MMPGSGAAATVDGRRVAVGRLAWALGEVGWAEQPGTVDAADAAVPDGVTRVYVCQEGDGVLGHVDLSDALKEDAVEAIRALQDELGFDVYVCSGDAEPAVQATARAVGIRADRALSGQSP